MKKIHLLPALLLLTSAAYSQIIKTDSLIMGPGYKNEVYYSLRNGTKNTAEIKTWDIAFSAPNAFDGRFYGIMLNHINGVKVYPYRKAGTAGWAAFDSSGWKSWKPLYNTDTAWYKGAFNLGPESHPRYGWGEYTASGEITGDSLYLITLDSTGKSTQFRKLWIEQVKSSSGDKIWKFKYANLDGSNEQSVTINATNDYASRNFAYYSMRYNKALNREPDNSAWDFVLTRYYALQPDGHSHYPSTGILSNYDVLVAKAAKVDTGNVQYDDYNGQYKTNISTIGYDWKTLRQDFSGYDAEDSTCYFIKDKYGDIYRLVFNSFSMIDGKTVFNFSRQYHNTSLESIRNNGFAAVYPNPATDNITLLLDNNKQISGYQIIDMTGKVHAQQNLNDSGFVFVNIPVAQLPSGIYTIKIDAGGQAYYTKFVKQ